MKLYIYKSKSNSIFYMVKSFRKDGKSTSKIVEKLGTLEEVKQKAGDEDPVAWAKKYIAQRTAEEKENCATFYEKLVEGKDLTSEQKVFNLGHIFLHKIFAELELDNLCKEIRKKYKFKFELFQYLFWRKNQK